MSEGGKRIQAFHDLQVWQKAHQMVRQVYRLTQTFPSHEQFGVTSQLRRAAVSVASNIVEGHARGKLEFIQFLVIARGSLEEAKYLLWLANDLQYVKSDQYRDVVNQTDEIGKMIHGLTRAQKNSNGRR